MTLRYALWAGLAFATVGIYVPALIKAVDTYEIEHERRAHTGMTAARPAPADPFLSSLSDRRGDQFAEKQ